MNAKVGLLAIWLSAILTGSTLDLWHEEQFLPPPESREIGDVLIDVVGEFKTVIARYLWFRMDLFHEVLDDQGVEASQQSEVLPLLRMVTLLDPSMTDSYDTIVWDLYKGQGQTETALQLLEEGLKRNPSSYQLNFRRGLIAFLEKDNRTALDQGLKALKLTDKEFEQLDCLRLIYWSAKEMDDRETQKRALVDLLILRPEDALWSREMKKLQSR
ncbi:MAG: hypothetical protein KC800_33175 [Candidatus Eremiobacteraeota bacterium]|nr:hypothetical protein [Candidatus Eremiobacteraeota bacterium]